MHGSRGTIPAMTETESAHENITPLAITNWRDIRRKFGIKEKNRRGHLYILGKSGTGKSSLIGNMIVSDMAMGYGLALIDPHGDLAEAVLSRVPEKRLDDVIYFDPADLEHPIAFNPLEPGSIDNRHLIASGLISTFKKIWPEFWGPRMEHILRNALLTLLELPGSTLVDLPRILLDATWRARIVPTLRNGAVREFWQTEYDRYPASFRNEAASPILNKIGQFLTNVPLRRIICHPRSSFDIRQVMDQGKILIANLSKGRIGEDCSGLLGSMLVTKLHLTALSRADTPESSRKFFYLYVDEVQNFLTDAFSDMLSESRKFGLSLTLAHQYTSQLEEGIRSSILGNVGTLLVFRLGTEDAKMLAPEFAPAFGADDLIKLPNYHLYVKLMIDGVTSDPFSAVTWPMTDGNQSVAHQVIDASRRNYARLPNKDPQPRARTYDGTSFTQNKLL